MSIISEMTESDAGFILRFGIVGGFIGMIIYSPFETVAPILIRKSVYDYVLTALVVGWLFIGCFTAAVTGVVFWWWRHKRGMANGHQERSWWIACLVGALPLILLKVIATTSAGNLLITLAHTVWTCLFFFVCVVLTVRVLELSAQRQYKRLALLGVLGLVWFLYPVIHRAPPGYPG